jgi:hypothetical protein
MEKKHLKSFIFLLEFFKIAIKSISQKDFKISFRSHAAVFFFFFLKTPIKFFAAM